MLLDLLDIAEATFEENLLPKPEGILEVLSIWEMFTVFVTLSILEVFTVLEAPSIFEVLSILEVFTVLEAPSSFKALSILELLSILEVFSVLEGTSIFEVLSILEALSTFEVLSILSPSKIFGMKVEDVIKIVRQVAEKSENNGTGIGLYGLFCFLKTYRHDCFYRIKIIYFNTKTIF